MSRIVGNYILRDLIGRGATSDVYAGEHRFLGDPVAIKLLRAEAALSAQVAEAFVTEAARTRAIEHPNVVRVIDFGCDDAGCCYLVMERLEGDDLAARLRRDGSMPEHQVRQLGAAIADGMQAAHDLGIVHRDLKPANVMLCAGGPKIVDFGIAKHLGAQSAAMTQRRVGTPAYMAPEQLAGGLISPSVDVWALGVILFEAVAGRLPFEGFDDGRCPQLFEAAPRLGAHATVSPAFEALVARCLEREPGLRPASMAALARDLRCDPDDERFTADLGALPPPPAARSARRWWLIATIPAVAFITLISLRTFSRSPSRAPLPAPAPVVHPERGSARERGPSRRTAPAQHIHPDAAPTPASRTTSPAIESPKHVRPKRPATKRLAPKHPRPTGETLD